MPAPLGAAVVEALESRQFLSATLAIENLDVVPGFERMIFNRIGRPDPRVPNVVHDRGVLRLRNTGDQVLQIRSLRFNGPWRILGTAPTSIRPGGFANLTIQFTATRVPAFTYNQTAGTTSIRGGGAYIGSLTISSNAANRPAHVEELAGWYQARSENNEEPSLQTIVNLISNYPTRIANTRTHVLPQPTGKRLYGEEVNSAHWLRADPTRGVTVRQLAAFHAQGNPVVLRWHYRGSFATSTLYTTAGADGQTFLPHLQGRPTSPAVGSFNPGSNAFGFRIDNEWSDDRRNNRSGGGHHVRFYPLRDHHGNILRNTYLMAMDYSVVGAGASAQNSDFQDNVYIVSNVRPAGN